MPTTENDRRNLQEPVLAHPSLPDRDRKNDAGMHAVQVTAEQTSQAPQAPQEASQTSETVDLELELAEENAPPDQEFEQILKSGANANNGRIPEDPNNELTSEPEEGYREEDPENRGESLPDNMENIRH